MKYNFGFTLSEVLITLGIIGVVAAITVPSLMAKISENKYKSQYKKIFSELNQAYRLLENEGESPNTVCESWDDKCFRDLFTKQIKIAHICNEKFINNNKISSFCISLKKPYYDIIRVWNVQNAELKSTRAQWYVRIAKRY